ncbi:PREDICTED: uncharacterized protein LOC105563257, partial [Vollenhovia emeryi]|uniref:uncharacterized protein LOC105563257 n=1 Tax=Vollenhovia emeryi TaxID=411798 RepID=UPI0005F55B2E
MTDHKPLVYAFQQRSDKASPRQLRQLSYIAQFTTALEHLAGSENLVADNLSRIEALRLPVEFELVDLAARQKKDEELKHLLISNSSSLKLKKFIWGASNTELYCKLSTPDGRFDHVHMDIVGPLHPSNGFTYCLTIIDRFSRWPEAIPILDITAKTVARAFFDNWVARFGAPNILTTDQGQQFEAQLFSALLKLIGCKRIRTTAYHPAANGMIERWHRTFKAAIMCHNTPNWVDVLPTVLLGLRTHLRMDTKASPAEFLYGTVLRIPGEFFLEEDFTPDPQIFVDDFRQHMRQVKPVPVAHHYKKRVFQFKELSKCSHVFL